MSVVIYRGENTDKLRCEHCGETEIHAVTGIYKHPICGPDFRKQQFVCCGRIIERAELRENGRWPEVDA